MKSTNLQAWMDVWVIPRQKPKTAIFYQITGIIVYRFRNECFKYLLHLLSSQAIHPAYLNSKIHIIFPVFVTQAEKTQPKWNCFSISHNDAIKWKFNIQAKILKTRACAHFHKTYNYKCRFVMHMDPNCDRWNNCSKISRKVLEDAYLLNIHVSSKVSRHDAF